MASLPWSPWVQGALYAPIASSGASAVLLMGFDGSMWGLGGNWNVNPQEVATLAHLIKQSAGAPISCTLGGVKFMGMRADESEFVSNSTQKTVVCGFVLKKTVIVAFGALDNARNINAALSKVVEHVSQDPSVASTLN